MSRKLRVRLCQLDGLIADEHEFDLEYAHFAWNPEHQLTPMYQIRVDVIDVPDDASASSLLTPDPHS